MALQGSAFLALWNDIAREREPEYDRWHTREHVPERVAVNGFKGARRYVNRTREQHRYFTLYEVADLSVFDSPEYQDVVANPTPWSASMRPDFSNFLRAPCRVAASTGDGLGGAVAVLCYQHRSERGNFPLAALSDMPGVTGVHLGEATPVETSVAWDKQAPGAATVRPFDRVALIEALDRVTAGGALTHACAAAGLAGQPADFGCDVYDLAFVFPAHDADAPRRHRRAHWVTGNS